MKLKLRVVLAGLMLLTLSASLWAAESDAEDSDENKRQTSTEAKKESTQGKEKKGTDGVFLPSEEISEDFAVSFPVDI
ncbi:MAG: hypothetical protein ACR2PZ_14820 [Pseudomonadales bacterium]